MKVHCTSSVTSQRCPNCSSELTQANYFSAIKDGTMSQTGYDNGGTITTSTEYRDVQSHVGEICLSCCKAAERKQRVNVAKIAIISMVICLAMTIISIWFYLAHVLAIVAGFVGLIFVIGAVCMKPPNYENLSADEISLRLVSRLGTASDSGEERFLGGRVLLADETGFRKKQSLSEYL
jgi:hypothetical protein